MSGAQPIIFSNQVAAALNWDTQRARRWLLKTGAGEKRAGRVITTPSKLVEHFPEAWQPIASGMFDEREL